MAPAQFGLNVNKICLVLKIYRILNVEQLYPVQIFIKNLIIIIIILLKI